MTIKAPFSPDQVVLLNEYQVGPAHPFTCVNRGDGNHRTWNGDLGALVATTRGWVCPFCEYTQDWAHGGMADPEFIERIAQSLRPEG